MKNLKEAHTSPAGVSFSHLNSDLVVKVMENLSLSEKGALTRTCRLAWDAWEKYPFSRDDYGSAIPHRYLGTNPSVRDWMEVTRDRGISGPPVPYRAILGGFSAFRSDEGPARATMTLAKMASCIRGPGGRFPEQDPRFWGVYASALVHLHRQKEARWFEERIDDLRAMSSALERRDGQELLALVDRGVPIGEWVSCDYAFRWGQCSGLESKAWLVQGLSRSTALRRRFVWQLKAAGEQHKLGEWLVGMWQVAGPVWEALDAVDELPLTFFDGLFSMFASLFPESNQQAWDQHMRPYLGRFIAHPLAATWATQNLLCCAVRASVLEVADLRCAAFLRAYVRRVKPGSPLCYTLVNATFSAVQTLPWFRISSDSPEFDRHAPRLNLRYRAMLGLNKEINEVCPDRTGLAVIYQCWQKSTALLFGGANWRYQQTWLDDLGPLYGSSEVGGQAASDSP